MARTPEMAREIIRVGIANDAYEEPKDGVDALGEEKIQKEAVDLVQLARNAYDRKIVSDAVLEILFAAQVEPTAEEPEKYKEVYERKGKPLPAPAAAESPAQEQAEDGKLEIDSIIEGYDDLKVSDLKKLIPDMAAGGLLNPEQWEQVKAYEAANEERKSILKLEPEFKKTEPAAPHGFATGGVVAPTGDYGSSADLQSAYESGSLGSDRISQEGLPVPPQFQGEAQALPIDITSISDQELSRLAMQYHSLHARTVVLISQEEGRAAAATHLRDDAEREAYQRHFSRLKSGAKDTAAAITEAKSEAKHEASVDDSVKNWRTRAVRHGIEAKNLKALDIGYEDAETRLSREQSRREKLQQS